jgi:hypothetical protein
MGVIAVFSVVIYLLAVHYALPEEKVDEYMHEVVVVPSAAH